MNREYCDGLVSVIIPVYNAERFIQNTLESVLNQTYKDIEIVLVDDCSNDHSSTIIEEYRKKNSNIIYYKFEENKGVGEARNKALELGKGRYVAFLDSDDLWKKEKIERQINLMKKTNTSLCYTAIEMIDDEDKVIKKKRKVSETCSWKKLLKNTMLATSTIVIDRKQTGDFRMPSTNTCEDYATWLMILRKGTVARGINEALCSYRTGNKNSLSSKKTKNYQNIIKVQINQEKISPIAAYFNAFCYIVNSVKKYYF